MGLAITACGFTAEAYEFAEHTRITLLDGGLSLTARHRPSSAGHSDSASYQADPVESERNDPDLPGMPHRHGVALRGRGSLVLFLDLSEVHARRDPAPPRRTLGHLSQDGEWQRRFGSLAPGSATIRKHNGRPT